MNQPRKFNTHEPSQIEAEHHAALENPNLETMFSPEKVCDLLGISSTNLFAWVRAGKFPEPDFIMGYGPRAVRRWWPESVFSGIAASRELTKDGL